jgi:CheY-like chemotaxis protein
MNEPKAKNRGRGNKVKSMIFVVDDEPMLLELAAVILEPLGYVVKTFRSPESAVQAFTTARPPPGLVITDYAMHTMNGLDLIEACRHVQPQQKILMVSGTVDSGVYRNSPTKPNRFLAKPYHAKQLAETVSSLLGD